MMISREMYYPESEHGVLGAIMMASLNQDQSLVDDIVARHTSADFYHPDNASLFDAIKDCLERGMPVDAVTVGAIQRTLPSGQSTMAYAAEISHKVPSVANWKAYSAQVNEWAVVRAIINVGQITAQRVEDGEPLGDVIAASQQSMADLRELRAPRTGYKRMSEVVPVVLDGMDDHVNDRSPPKLSTGLTELDNLIGFLRPKSMVVIAGRPGSGKTMLGLQIMQSVAVNGKGVGLIYSLEMGEAELTTRAIASLGGVDLRRMENAKELGDEEWSRIGMAVGQIRDAELYLNDEPGMTIGRIRSEALQFQREKGLDILMVDYLGLIGSDRKAANRAESVGAISIALKNLSKELSVPVLVLAQLNRNSTGRVGKKPQASDLRDSGQVEQDADLVLLVHHDTESDAGQNGVSELILDKGRQAPAGSCLVQRQGQFARFVNFDGNRQFSQEVVEMGRPFAERAKGRKHHE
ncbi:DnaB-like helicase C-terminal domain-containing protein [Pseudomonas sp. G.S.17]|uniref:replicative DNA helicase n=1 Tax=Pseudomonas sp. G.S.17 TaxID=3137451 RepID=UPI00311CBFB3